MNDGDKLEQVYREMLEEKIIALLAQKHGCSPENAMDLFYHSKLAEQIAEGKYGIQYLEPSVLVGDLIANEPGLFDGSYELAD